VTSDAYRLSTSAAGSDAQTIAADPDNRFYWRMSTRRMESQIVRDSLLHLAGVLDPKLGGPSLEAGADSTRRSLYFKHSRDDQNKFLSLFDDADHLQCYRRTESIVPQQSLALFNSQLAIEMSEKIAQELAKAMKHPGRGEFIGVAFETLLGRTPDDAERSECLAYCEKLAALLKDVPKEQIESRIQARLVQALLNHNDFISIR
jgi:hypothetical protein